MTLNTALFDLYAPLVLELLLLELGGRVELQLAPHPLPLPAWAGLRSDEIISMTFRTLNRIGSSYDMFLSRHCCAHVSSVTFTGILNTDSTSVVWLCSRSPRLRLKSFTGVPRRWTAACTKVYKVILNSPTYLVSFQKCQ